ncbi:MAG: 5,6-dimethylbenzimidazole synthase [Nitrospira sp.]|nr:5,6-dimethylbenzimidazole synthase [Nitrospira sp.]
MTTIPGRFSDAERAAVYRAIVERRDVRRNFLPDPIPEEVFIRLLTAAHHAGSVGFMQPWDFIVIRDPATKGAVKRLFLEANADAARRYKGKKGHLYRQLKLEGIEEAPVNLCVTCSRRRGGPHVLGRSTVWATDLYSTCCAVQNLWLAARAEGIGVGWVSIVDHDKLKALLGVPKTVTVVAYLCLGYVSVFEERPDLETVGWRRRIPLERLIHSEVWGNRTYKQKGDIDADHQSLHKDGRCGKNEARRWPGGVEG